MKKLLAIFLALADGFGNFSRFAHPAANVAIAIANDNQRSKAHVPAALNRFGDPVDGYDLIVQLQIAVIDLLQCVALL